MSEFDYDEMAALAVEMLNDFGRPAVLARTGGAASSTAKRAGRAVDAATVEQQDIRTVVLDLNWSSDDGRLVKKATAVLIVEPQKGDTITQGSAKPYTVRDIRPIAPVGDALYYLAEVI